MVKEPNVKIKEVIVDYPSVAGVESDSLLVGVVNAPCGPDHSMVNGPRDFLSKYTVNGSIPRDADVTLINAYFCSFFAPILVKRAWASVEGKVPVLTANLEDKDMVVDWDDLSPVEANDANYLEITPSTGDAIVSISMSTIGANIEYSYDKLNWIAFTGTNEATIQAGQSLYLRGTNTTINTHAPANDEYTKLVVGSGNVNIKGDLTSLLNGKGGITDLSEKSGVFEGFFLGAAVADASGLILPSTTLGAYCYSRMFEKSELTKAPALPATNLAVGCYKGMFKDCILLTESPELNVASLPAHCYELMFNGCSVLSEITCLATNFSYSDDCTTDWVVGVAASGTFKRSADMPQVPDKSSNGWIVGDGTGIPSGWTVDPAFAAQAPAE